MQQPIPTLTASNVGRAALAAYLKTLAGAVAQDGVTVNMVLPGRIDTDRVARRPGARPLETAPAAAARRRGRSRRAPSLVGRYGRPAEFGAVVAFLAGEPAAFVTGEQVRVDGGLVAGY